MPSIQERALTIPNLQLVLKYACRRPAQVARFAYVNAIFAETLYTGFDTALLLFDRLADKSSRVVREFLFHVCAHPQGPLWIVRVFINSHLLNGFFEVADSRSVGSRKAAHTCPLWNAISVNRADVVEIIFDLAIERITNIKKEEEEDGGEFDVNEIEDEELEQLEPDFIEYSILAQVSSPRYVLYLASSFLRAKLPTLKMFITKSEELGLSASTIFVPFLSGHSGNPYLTSILFPIMKEIYMVRSEEEPVERFLYIFDQIETRQPDTMLQMFGGDDGSLLGAMEIAVQTANVKVITKMFEKIKQVVGDVRFAGLFGITDTATATAQSSSQSTSEDASPTIQQANATTTKSSPDTLLSTILSMKPSSAFVDATLYVFDFVEKAVGPEHFKSLLRKPYSFKKTILARAASDSDQVVLRFIIDKMQSNDLLNRTVVDPSLFTSMMLAEVNLPVMLEGLKDDDESIRHFFGFSRQQIESAIERKIDIASPLVFSETKLETVQLIVGEAERLGILHYVLLGATWRELERNNNKQKNDTNDANDINDDHDDADSESLSLQAGAFSRCALSSALSHCHFMDVDRYLFEQFAKIGVSVARVFEMAKNDDGKGTDSILRGIANQGLGLHTIHLLLKRADALGVLREHLMNGGPHSRCPLAEFADTVMCEKIEIAKMLIAHFPSADDLATCLATPSKVIKRFGETRTPNETTTMTIAEMAVRRQKVGLQKLLEEPNVWADSKKWYEDVYLKLPDVTVQSFLAGRPFF